MPYLFAVEDQDYSDYSSGRVIYNLPGATAFPVRLASEIFQRAQKLLDLQRPLSIYDPTCGSAYHLTTLGFLHGDWIKQITASDIAPEALSMARRNLGLLSPDGLILRIREIQQMLEQFGKASHADAIKSAAVLKARLDQIGRSIPTRIFQANALDRSAIQSNWDAAPVDLVISDVPYGQHSTWQAIPNSTEDAPSALWLMLDALLPVLGSPAVVAIAADKRQKVAHASFRRVGHFGIGKREITLLVPTAPHHR